MDNEESMVEKTLQIKSFTQVYTCGFILPRFASKNYWYTVPVAETTH